jgi:hypothetical protein
MPAPGGIVVWRDYGSWSSKAQAVDDVAKEHRISWCSSHLPSWGSTFQNGYETYPLSTVWPLGLRTQSPVISRVGTAQAMVTLTDLPVDTR